LASGGWPLRGGVLDHNTRPQRGSLSPPPDTVYNFEVAGTHTYFVGESEAWVHNSCFKSADELAKFFNTTRSEFHKKLKKEIISDGAAFASKIGSTNPDIGISQAGNIMFRHPRTRKTIETDLVANWFAL
jgi:hypothetical protein